MNEFLIPTDWFYKKYFGVLPPQRYWSFKVALNIFLQRGGEVIIETGSVGGKNDWAAGNSTYLFGDFCQHYNKKLITIDNREIVWKIAQECTQEFKENIEYILGDSVEFLEKYKERIDLLYLDSLDYPLDGNDPKMAQEHNLKEIKVAYDRFTPQSVVLLDDYDFPDGGKPKLTNEFLEKEGWICLLGNQQALWIKQ